jgi:hypothetical protein
MALEFSSKSALISRAGGDHQAHLRSIGRVLARSIASNIDDRTNKIDGRSGARAKVSSVKAYNTASGSTGYSITITQNIMPDVSEDKRKKIQKQHAAVKSQLASKNGVISLLNSGGVH